MNSPAPSAPTTLPPKIGMGAWNAYFLGKFALYWWEAIGFHPLENLAFALVLVLPVTSPALWRARSLLAWPSAIALLYYDSWLPPVSRLISQGNLLASFSPAYLAELIGRFLNLQIVALLVVVGVGYVVLTRWLRLGVVVMATLLSFVAGILPSGPSAPSSVAGTVAVSPEARLRDFYARESGRSVKFSPPTAGEPPFDVIFLHVCSLSWDDLQAMGLESHPLLARFDILLTHFNSVASYSGPAAIRLQRAACGQLPHASLYNPAPPGCSLMEGLQQAGFQPELALNHDGHFDNFLGFIQAQAGMTEVAPQALDDIKVTQYSFDGSAVYDDNEVLGRWLENRSKTPSQRRALYYNTVSLHDGNRLSGDQRAITSIETFKLRLTRLLDDLDTFLKALEQSGRPAVVALVPEHGAAVRGDRMQIAGLREIPSPGITLVPVGIKVVGAAVRREGPPVRIDTPSSFLAMAEIVSRLVAKPPFTDGRFTAGDYVGDLPTTPFVAENDGVIVMQTEAGFMLRQANGEWSDYKIGP